jgi:ribonucleoside-diphosphate reductase alpha chain
VDDLGDRWVEFEVFHHNVKEYINMFGTKKEDLPDYFVTSDKIDWVERINVQAALQQSIDHSVSNTINLPANTSNDIVSTLYLEGWKRGLKGVTVYVDGSRSGVLVTESSGKKELFDYKDAIQRPTELKCDIHKVTVKGDKWTILVGLVGKQPYEVFAGKSKYVEIPKKYTSGVIIKRERATVPSRYDLHFGEDGVIKDIGTVFENEDFQTAGRLISALLRHGVAPSFITEQLSKDKNEALDGFHKVVSRVLKKYIKDGTRVASDKACDECKQETLIYQDGCVICSNCGWSRCS